MNYKISILAFYLTIFNCSSIVLAQRTTGGIIENPDSLREILKSSSSDSLKIITLFKLSESSPNPSEGLVYAQEAYKLSYLLKNSDYIALSLFYLSFKNNLLGSWAKGMEYAFQGLQLAEESLPRYKPLFKEMMGGSFEKQRDYRSALKWSKSALNDVLNGLDGLPFSKWAGYFTTSSNLVKLGITDSVLAYTDSALVAVHVYKIPLMLTAYCFRTKGGAFTLMHQKDSALKYYHFALDTFKKYGDPFAYQEVQRDMAEMYYYFSHSDSSEYYAQQAMAGGKVINNIDVMMDVSNILYKIYETKNTDKAFGFLKIYLRLKDSIFNRDRFNQVYQLQISEKQKEIELNQKDAAVKVRIRTNSLLGIIGTVALISLLLGYNYKQKSKQHLVLSETNKRLIATQAQLIQSEKLASLGELTAGIAHEIQNPLNFVNNFSSINADLIDELKMEIDKGNTEEVKSIATDIKDNEEKIIYHGKRAESIVRNMLQHSSKSSGVKELTDINALADEYLRLSYHGLRAKDKNFNAEFKMDLDSSCPLVNLIPQDIGRVLLNLFNNAFWAVSEKKKGKMENGEKDLPSISPASGLHFSPMVTLITKKLSDDKIEIRVRDNGLGIPQAIKDKIFQPFFTTKPTGQGTGLGLSLAYDIVKTHGGDIILDSTVGQGSEFIITLPV